jgi:hypothetical protein
MCAAQKYGIFQVYAHVEILVNYGFLNVHPKKVPKMGTIKSVHESAVNVGRKKIHGWTRNWATGKVLKLPVFAPNIFFFGIK